MIQAYSYRRWSSDIQSLGSSLARQTESAAAVCKAKNWQLDTSLDPDSGVSAWKGANLSEGSLGKFKHAVETGRIKTPCVLVIDDLSRFSRLPAIECLDALRELVTLNVTICTANDGKEYNKASLNDLGSMIYLFVSAHQNNSYSQELSRKLGVAWEIKREKAKNGEILTRSLPAWIQINEKTGKLEESKEQADLVRSIFRSFVDGVPIRTIVRQLNAAKVPPFGRGKQNKGNGWNASHMRRLLCSRSVLGEYQPHLCIKVGKKRVRREPIGEPLLSYYPQVVSKELFYRAQSILERHASPGKRGNKLNATNLFTGKVTCACCGRSMFIKQGGSGPKYDYTSLICNSAVRGNGCPYRTIQYKHVERAVLSVLWSVVIPKLKQANSVEAQLLQKRGERTFLANQIERLNEALVEEKVRPKSVLATIAKYEQEVEELNVAIEKLEAIGQDHGIASWVPLEQTTENRLRLGSVLRDVILNISIDANKREATLQVKLNPDEVVSFNLAWEGGRGAANQNKSNPADTHFIFEGKRLPYVDQLLVWKSVLSVDSMDVPVYAQYGEPEVLNLSDVAILVP